MIVREDPCARLRAFEPVRLPWVRIHYDMLEESLFPEYQARSVPNEAV
jgi:hypothetical protein